jgi:hypothetical protein
VLLGRVLLGGLVLTHWWFLRFRVLAGRWVPRIAATNPAPVRGAGHAAPLPSPRVPGGVTAERVVEQRHGAGPYTVR